MCTIIEDVPEGEKVDDVMDIQGDIDGKGKSVEGGLGLESPSDGSAPEKRYRVMGSFYNYNIEQLEDKAEFTVRILEMYVCGTIPTVEIVIEVLDGILKGAVIHADWDEFSEEMLDVHEYIENATGFDYEAILCGMRAMLIEQFTSKVCHAFHWKYNDGGMIILFLPRPEH